MRVQAISDAQQLRQDSLLSGNSTTTTAATAFATAKTAATATAAACLQRFSAAAVFDRKPVVEHRLPPEQLRAAAAGPNVQDKICSSPISQISQKRRGVSVQRSPENGLSNQRLRQPARFDQAERGLRVSHELRDVALVVVQQQEQCLRSTLQPPLPVAVFAGRRVDCQSG